MTAPAVIRASGVTVRFGAFVALDDVSLDFQAGEIHAIVGENGAGKSTLMKVLSGELRATSGTFDKAPGVGVAIVHQHFQLVETLTAAENMFLGRPRSAGRGPFGLLRRRALVEAAAAELSDYGLAAKADVPVRELGVAERQLIEIARACGKSAQVLILDEPTASLGEAEADALFARVRRMAAAGTCVILIAHSLEEVLSVADRITVLRSGRNIATVRRGDIDRAELVRLIIGRELDEGFPRGRATGGPLLLKATGVMRDVDDADMPLCLAGRQVFGMPTYVSALTDRILDQLGGAAAAQGAVLHMDGATLGGAGVAERVRHGICMVPGDAIREGVVASLTVAENIMLPNMKQVSRCGVIDRHQGRALAQKMIRELGIRPPDPDALASQLSGGNRQKVVIAKWIAAGARVLLMNDPTKAVDVGAKLDIYRLIDEAAAQGAAVLLVSSDVDELLGMADSITVVHRSMVVAVHSSSPFDKAEVLDQMVSSRSANA